MNVLLSRSDVVSLAFASICIVLFAYFPTNENVWEDIAAMIAFFVVLPLLYITFILKQPFSSLELGLPQFTKKKILAISGVLILGVIYALGIFYTPYNASYILDIAPIFTTFKGFSLYHLVFVLPSILLVSFFSLCFLRMLDLPRAYYLLCGGLCFTLVLTSLLSLPLILSPLFAVTFLLLSYYKVENMFILTLGIFLFLLTYNSLISKALLNTKI